MANVTFGDELRVQLRNRKMSAAELSRRSGVSKQHLSKLLNNERSPMTGVVTRPSEETVSKIARGMGWDIDEALLAAGYAPQTVATRPTTIPELVAAKGVVAVRLDGCDTFLVYVQTSDDYTVMEWMGGYDPDKGDVLYGSFNSYGSHNLYYGDRKTSVYIEDYGLDRGDALEQLYEQCD